MPVAIHDLINSNTPNWDSIRLLLKGHSPECRNLFRSGNFDEEGFNPFHHACKRCDVPPDVINLMVRADESNLVEKTRVGFDDGEEISPLHLACESGSARTVKALLALLNLNSYDERDYILNDKFRGVTPLTTVWSRYIDPGFQEQSAPPNDAEEAMNFLHDLERLQPAQDLDMNAKVKDTWEKTIALVVAVTTGSTGFPLENGRQWNIVHSIADGGESRCPSIVLWVALKLYPNQARWADEEGNLPLHIAALSEPLDELCADTLEFDTAAKETFEETQAVGIHMLVELYPDAAKVRNAVGRLPLHIACDSKVGWKHGIASIAAAAPEAINARDPFTRLFPFMLAALYLEEGDRDDDDNEVDGEHTHDCLESVYMLLRANPENVKGGIRKTAYEEYLEKKLAKKATAIADLELQRHRDLDRITELESKLRKRKFESQS